MKKIFLVAFVLCSAMAYSQEIRVPDEKRESYSKDKNQTDRTVLSTQQQKERDLQAQRKREEYAKKTGARTGSSDESATVYCIIQEFSYPGKPGKERVIILNAFDQMGDVKMDPKKAEQIKATLSSKRNYASGLDALQHYQSMGWVLENVSVYPSNEEVVREYMMKM